MVRAHNREGRDGRAISLIIWFRGELVGQISMGGIIYGAMRGAHIGYWVDEKFANLGVVTAAVEALSEYAFTELNLHRLEINLRPENGASRRVAEKAGYQLEGRAPPIPPHRWRLAQSHLLCQRESIDSVSGIFPNNSPI
jgi:ribosomal-protein-alanine N-acetyltransferase